MTTTHAQDKRFRQMLDAAPDAIIVVDQRGSVVALNWEAERLCGWTDAELLGEPSGRAPGLNFLFVYGRRPARRPLAKAPTGIPGLDNSAPARGRSP